MGEKRYTLEQIIDVIIQSYDDITCAVQMQDRNMLEDVLKDYLH